MVGTGAVQLAASLLPALERSPLAHVCQLYLPDRGELAHYQPATPALMPVRQRRVLPNALSRLVECLFPGRRFGGQTPLLVLGDLPLRCRSPQVVFVHTLHLTRGSPAGSVLAALKYAIARAVFRINMRRPTAFVVQTEAMKTAVLAPYPRIADRVHVIPQPVPAWLPAAGVKRTGRRANAGDPLTLVYPAANYPHKNHRLLAHVGNDASAWPVQRLVLTIPAAADPNPAVPWIHCVGALAPQAVAAAYGEADALLFLSKAESYGFPLVEAMWSGLPIVCPDLPYARSLCGEQAIYFDPLSIDSLRAALQTLQTRLRKGWWPDWSARLSGIPGDWDAVAAGMIELLLRAPRSASRAVHV